MGTRDIYPHIFHERHRSPNHEETERVMVTYCLKRFIEMDSQGVLHRELQSALPIRKEGYRY